MIERRLAERGKTPAQASLEEMDALWDEAKQVADSATHPAGDPGAKEPRP